MFFDGTEHSFLSLLNLLQFVALLLYLGNLNLVERASSLLSVTADERDCSPSVEKVERVFNLPVGNAYCLGYHLYKNVHFIAYLFLVIFCYE